MIFIVFLFDPPISLKNVDSGSILSELKQNSKMSSTDDVSKEISKIMEEVVQYTSNSTENIFSDKYCRLTDSLDNNCKASMNSGTNKENILQEIENWYTNMKKLELTQLDPEYENILKPLVKPNLDNIFYSIVPCSTSESIWSYKYSGSKGKNRIFHGKGKLSFTKHNSPPHGYDYGMKSGHCLRMKPEHQQNIESIEGIFDKEGILNGQGIKVKYRNGQLLKATMIQGVIHGLYLQHNVRLDPETNQPTPDSPALSKIIEFQNGKEKLSGYTWHFLQNGIKILENKDNANESLIIVPKSTVPSSAINQTENVSPEEELESDDIFLRGQLDLNDMMLLNAKTVQPVNLKTENKILIVDVAEENIKLQKILKHTSPSFTDYDLVTKSWTNAITGKLHRFLDIITDSKKTLQDNFEPMMQTDTKNESFPFFKEIEIAQSTDITPFVYIHVFCPYDRNKLIKAKLRRTDLSRDKKLSGMLELEMVSTVTRKDLNEIIAATKETPTRNDTSKRAYDHTTNATYEDELLTYKESPYRFISNELVESIRGNFENGKLRDGTVARIKFTDSSVMEGFVQNNSFHGIVRFLDPPIAADKLLKRYSKNNQIQTVRQRLKGLNQDQPTVEVKRVALYKNGLHDGPSWDFFTGSMLYTKFKGKNGGGITFGAHLDNFFEIAYVGRFKNGIITSGHLADIIGQDDVEQFRVPRFSSPISEKIYHSIEIQSLNESNLTSKSSQIAPTLVTDPVEDKWIYVNDSKIKRHLYSQKEEGVFAKMEIPSNQLISFYGGYRYNKSVWEEIKELDPKYASYVYTDPGKSKSILSQIC